MRRQILSTRYALIAIVVTLATGCDGSNTVAGTNGDSRHLSSTLVASSISAVDISNGVTGGGGRTISSNGVILGKIGSTRGWWQSPSSTFHTLDDNWVQGGNRNADAGGGQGTALLSTNGGAPWTSVVLASPAGINAGSTIAHDMNGSRVIVGNTLGSDVYAIRWDAPSALPVKLELPALQYPAYQVVARSINNSGVIVGYVLETLPRKRSRYEALIWSGGTVSILPLPPGGTTQLASNINDAGVISGITEGAHPIKWTPRAGGGYDILVSSVNVGRSNLDTAIDECGRIAGGTDAGAYVWEPGSPAVVFPGLGGTGKSANIADINEAGVAVGSSAVGTAKGSVVSKATMWTGFPSCAP